ncbi:6-phosphofructokinase isozyme 1 [Candidatus Annandia adelgestsuga]|uniref:ATP-dependent 6-phosphofructokinase n=1 Tax=Candidatus Annandia adelgestsuga TaxID=1302411 RepID=A0A3S9J7S7_9ENTR|nr:ATP-dependent 6-phosphofructokinase [Candidatus Annandia adelgestsuga]AZP36421.1 6-phosphofructokinase isozyme 1 [Candidatus Annandia adelgestsuga]
MIKKIGILTSGGDSPGMNNAIRSIVLSSIKLKIKIIGIFDGFLGLYKNRMIKLNFKSVFNLINIGGTFLRTSRFPKFVKKKIRLKSIKNLISSKIDALIIIGGNGSYMGAKCLHEMGFTCICLPGTIDNDINGTDYTIGYSTALENIVKSIDSLRDNSSSHQRISIVEIMGRNCGDLTLNSAIAGGCDFIILPEIPYNFLNLINNIKNKINLGKKHLIIAITENICNIKKLAKYIEITTKKETRTTILGYVQRGGIPIAYDRILASRMGFFAVELLLKGYSGKFIGIKNDKLIFHDIDYAFKKKKKIFKKKWMENIQKIF